MRSAPASSSFVTKVTRISPATPVSDVCTCPSSAFAEADDDAATEPPSRALQNSQKLMDPSVGDTSALRRKLAASLAASGGVCTPCAVTVRMR